MAASTDALSVLNDLDAILKEFNQGEFLDQFSLFSNSRVSRSIKPARNQKVVSNGIVYRFKTGQNDMVRWGRDPLQSIRVSKGMSAQELLVRFAEGSPSTNDFTRFAGAVRLSHIDVKRAVDGGEGAVAELASELDVDRRADFDTKIALANQLPKSGAVATVNGSIYAADATDTNALRLDTGTSDTLTASDTVRFAIDGGPIAAFQPNRYMVVYDSSDLNPVRFKVLSYNPVDNSVRAEPLSGEDFGTTAAAYDNGSIYFDNSIESPIDAGMYGMEEWFTEPTEGSAETWLGGVDRKTEGFDFLNPTMTRRQASSQSFQKSMLNDLAESMQYQHNESEQVQPIIYTDHSLHNAIRDAIGEDALQTTQAEDSKRVVDLGTMAVYYQHPAFGRTAFLSDALIKPNTLRFIRAGDWDMLHVGNESFETLPGDMGSGWYRVNDDGSGAGRSLYYQRDDYIMGLAVMCRYPKWQGAILNVTA